MFLIELSWTAKKIHILLFTLLALKHQTAESDNHTLDIYWRKSSHYLILSFLPHIWDRAGMVFHKSSNICIWKELLLCFCCHRWHSVLQAPEVYQRLAIVQGIHQGQRKNYWDRTLGNLLLSPEPWDKNNHWSDVLFFCSPFERRWGWSLKCFYCPWHTLPKAEYLCSKQCME